MAGDKMINQTDHDLLLRIDERLETVEKNLTNHLDHHFRYSFYAWTACIGLIITLIMLLSKLH
jgi:hypothetical protein